MSIQLRGGHTTQDKRLDRLPSAVTSHVEKFPLTSTLLDEVVTKPSSIVGGINWYSNFDNPTTRRIRGVTYHVVGEGSLGRIRGGHAINFPHWELRKEPSGWYLYYNQGSEGRCVEFATYRTLSQYNRKRYDINGQWLYHQAQMTDEWEGGSYPGASPFYEGTSVRAALEAVRLYGGVPDRIGARFNVNIKQPVESEGIAAYRWITNESGGWQLVRETLGIPDHLPGVPFYNSWGDGYPRRTLMLDEAGERVLDEWGEFGVATDR